MLSLFALLQPAAAQVPDRQIPPTVLSEVRDLENRFELALAQDCDPERCFSKGCTYVDHAVADRPRGTSLPGLSQDPGPGSVDAQEYLTRARCAFAHEASDDTKDIAALSRRLQTKLSKGWTSVSVSHQSLPAIPGYLQDPPGLEDTDTPEEEAEAERIDLQPPPEIEWSASVASRELWTQLLPHFWWMIGLGMLTLAAMLVIWAFRRVGRASIEEQMLLAQIANGDFGDLDEPEVEEVDADAEYVAEQSAAWSERMAAMDTPDPEIRALIHELLRSGDLPLLAKAVLTFPDTFPRAFPEGGEVAEAKLELATFLKSAEADDMPSDAEFYRALNRHALSATVAAQSDARIVRGLREDFGASGLASLIERVSPRPGALLFALAPATEQREVARLLPPRRVTALGEMLLRSNRMDPDETEHLFDVLAAVKAGNPLPAPPPVEGVSDRGSAFDAAGALSVLLPFVNPDQRAQLFQRALERFHGNLPEWTRGILLGEMLLELDSEARSDLFLAVELDGLSAWLSTLDADVRNRLFSGLPSSLQNSIRATSSFESRERQLSLAGRGRRQIARGFQRQLARGGVPFERVVAPASPGGVEGP